MELLASLDESDLLASARVRIVQQAQLNGLCQALVSSATPGLSLGPGRTGTAVVSTTEREERPLTPMVPNKTIWESGVLRQ